MGQKVDPRGFRVGITKSWPCEWFAKSKQQSAEFFLEDYRLRKMIEKYFVKAGIGKVVIRRNEEESELLLFTARPALVIGKNGKKLNTFQEIVEKKYKKSFNVVVKEIKVPELSAKVMSEFAVEQLEKRVPFRRVAKSLLQKVMEKGAIGIKVQIGGRLGGVDLARTEKFIEGRVPLQTLRSEVDYYNTTALTKYGILGVKIWIYKGDIYTKTKKSTRIPKLTGKSKEPRKFKKVIKK